MTGQKTSSLKEPMLALIDLYVSWRFAIDKVNEGVGYLMK